MLIVKELARQLDLNSLKEDCDQYLIDNFIEFASSEAFLAADFKEVLNLISRHELSAPQEQNVYDCLHLKVKILLMLFFIGLRICHEMD